MSSTEMPANSVRSRRLARNWSQQDLADRSGLSRAGISAIESGRLAPSVHAALTLARALDCTVEDLFTPAVNPQQGMIQWAVTPSHPRPRYWMARVEGRHLAYPVEDDSPQWDWHDGVVPDAVPAESALPSHPSPLADRTLVVACCDPAAGLLAAEYARQFQFRMIILRRSSRDALALLAAGKVHVAGVHLGHTGRKSENAQAARAQIAGPCGMVRVARWEEGLAVHPRFSGSSVASLLRGKARWVGREEGSGARQCQDEILDGRPTPRHIAFDHRSVVAAVRCGWADLGPCVRLASEEAGLQFIKVQEKDYDLVFRGSVDADPRLAALVATLRSRSYRAGLADLPGYATQHTGDLL